MDKLDCGMHHDASFSVPINEIPSEPFKPERELWQGDHLSQYIFVVCTEYLGRYIYANIPESGIDIKAVGYLLSNVY